MWRTKAETWALAEELGGDALVDLIVEETHTCYRGERGARHDWGYGCGACPACELRARGFAEWQSSKAKRKRLRAERLRRAAGNSKRSTTDRSDRIHVGCGRVDPTTE